jgi:peptidyl-prolyl cis-trans isomerase C
MCFLCLDKIRIIIVGAGIMLLLTSGCDRDREVEGTPLVKVDGTVITKEDVDRTWVNLPDEEKVKYMDRPGRQTLINNLVAAELLYQEALRQKLDQDPEVKGRLRKAEQNILVEELIGRSVQPGDLYRMYQENFVRAGSILIMVDPPTDPDADLKASRKISRIHKRLKNGEEFAVLAREYSEDISADRGGDLGYLTKKIAQMVFGFDAEQAIFSLKETGEFTAPVRGKNGYYIFRLIEKPGNLDPQGFDRQLGGWLFQEKSEEIFRGYVNELKSHARIENYEENLEDFLSLGDKKEAPVPENLEGTTSSGDD